MLLAQRQQLLAPLGSIEMLLSDPSVNAASIDISTRLADVCETRVDAADEVHFRESGERWLQRVRPHDVAIFYFSGHGITDRVGGAVGLLEDIRSLRNRPWAQSFGIASLAIALRTLSAQSAWIFFDACQEIVAEFADRISDVKNIELKEVTLRDLTSGSCEPLALAGAAMGRLAWAPGGCEPPFLHAGFAQRIKRLLRGTDAGAWLGCDRSHAAI